MTDQPVMYPEGTPMRRVIDYATQEFFDHGVRQVTMDSIAKGLQMSKRTLYQLFADKEQLIIACIEVIAQKERALTQSLVGANYNVLEIILRIIEHRLKAFNNISLQYVFDIHRYQSVNEYIELKHAEAVDRTVSFFRLGVQQGLFRSDVNFELMVTSILTRSNGTSISPNIERYTLQDCFITLGIFFLRGCCTPKGMELIDKFLARYRQEH